jgi:hypothetical protein
MGKVHKLTDSEENGDTANTFSLQDEYNAHFSLYSLLSARLNGTLN